MIKTASLAGFCFGVKRAIDTLSETVSSKKENEKVYTLGMIIHNPDVVRDFESKGVSVISSEDLERIFENTSEASPASIVIRAHGIEKEICEKLKDCSERNPYFKIVDCTCPFVEKIHNIAKAETSDDTSFIVFGNKDHPEVKSILSYAVGEKTVVSSLDEAEKFKTDKKALILTSQTTQKLSEWKKVQLFFKNYCTNAKIFDTICSVTEKRQEEAVSLAKCVDLMVVIGGKNSSNTKSLYDTSKAVLENTVLVENANELKSLGIAIPQKTGITAGASTPAYIIEEVYKTMSEEMVEKKESATFEEMLEDSLKTLNTGDIVTGVITSITSTEVHVDLSAKVTGILSVDELATEPGKTVNDLYKVGDTIEAFVVRVSDVEGVAGLSRRRIERMSDWKKVIEAYKEGTVLEGKVSEAVKGGVIISTGYTKVFVPASQTGLAKDADLSTLVGETHKFVIIDVNEQRNRAVASIKTVLRAERKIALEKFWEDIEEGKKYTGTVKSLTNYGVFVDLGGVDGMVHVSELTWSRVKTPADVVKVGDTLEVFVKSFDKEKKRISLGCKTAENNPWNVFMNTYKLDDVAPVTIVGITPFGAFAEIVPEVDGLIHISQIADKKIGNPAEYLSIGQTVEAKIIGIDEEKKKVSLSIRALLAPETPVEEEAEAAEAAEEAEEAEATEETPSEE